MPRGGTRDDREIFSVDSLRLHNKNEGPEQAPQSQTLELYFKNKHLFKMEDNGIETPIEALGFSASPGFTWGRSGTVNAGFYLLNDGVVSNTTGRLITFTTANLRKILIANENINTFTVVVEERDGFTGTVLATIPVVASRTKSINLNVPVTPGKELAVKILSGSCKNPVVGVFLDGFF